MLRTNGRKVQYFTETPQYDNLFMIGGLRLLHCGSKHIWYENSKIYEHIEDTVLSARSWKRWKL